MKGIIAAGSKQTAEAGAEMLRRGGNAVDAVVAAAFASFIGETIISTPAGGGFALLHAPGRDPVLYDFFCTAPGMGRDGLPPEMDFRPITVVYESGTSVYHIGRASSAVPGNIAGLAQLLEEAGTLPLAVTLEPAIRMAREGFALSAYQAYLIHLVEAILSHDSACLAIFAPEGRLLNEGEHFANPALADTLEQVAREGWQTFYTGALAEAIVADHAAHGGLITAEDLAAYRVIKREPLRFTYKAYTVYTNPPPSAGGMLIAYALRLFGRADLSSLTHGSADHIALLTEIMQQVNVASHRDRPAMLPDPAAWAAWLSDSHMAADWEAVAAALASGKARHSADIPGGPPATTHISAMDESGLAVGLTTTPGETAGYVVGETGILMNNILGEDALNPEGFHKWPPGTRPPSMMAPTIAADDSGPRLVAGSGGANRLRSAIFHFLSNVLDWGMPLAEAVDRPRTHLENGVIDLEGGYDPAAADELEARGYAVSRWPGRAFYFGGTHVTHRTRSGRLEGAGDPRRGGAVVRVE